MMVYVQRRISRSLEQIYESPLLSIGAYSNNSHIDGDKPKDGAELQLLHPPEHHTL
jgi:hypothetical protein